MLQKQIAFSAQPILLPLEPLLLLGMDANAKITMFGVQAANCAHVIAAFQDSRRLMEIALYAHQQLILTLMEQLYLGRKAPVDAKIVSNLQQFLLELDKELVHVPQLPVLLAQVENV